MNELTEEETAVLRLIAVGLTQCEVADSLCYSRDWVRKELKLAKKKLGAKTAEHAVYLGIREGYIDAGLIKKHRSKVELSDSGVPVR